MDKITRRLFLRNSAMVGTAAAVASPAVAAESEITPREQAIWHMLELVRLAKATGAEKVSVAICGHQYGGKPGYENCKMISIRADGGELLDFDRMFGGEGGAS
jgi:hypothetical protein